MFRSAVTNLAFASSHTASRKVIYSTRLFSTTKSNDMKVLAGELHGLLSSLLLPYQRDLSSPGKKRDGGEEMHNSDEASIQIQGEQIITDIELRYSSLPRPRARTRRVPSLGHCRKRPRSRCKLMTLCSPFSTPTLFARGIDTRDFTVSPTSHGSRSRDVSECSTQEHESLDYYQLTRPSLPFYRRLRRCS